MARPRWCAALPLVLAGCGDDGLAPGANERCGDGRADDGEVCLVAGRVDANISPRWLFAGDYDGDGTREFAGSYRGGGPEAGAEFGVLAVDGERLVERSHMALAAGERVDHALVVDVDGDARDELFAVLVLDAGGGDVVHFTRAGGLVAGDAGDELHWASAPLFAAAPAASGHPEHYIEAALGDFDGDGLKDVFLATSLSDAVVLRWDDGALAATAVDLSVLAAARRLVPAAGDLDGDGRDDLLLVDERGVVSTWRGEAGGGLAPGSLAVLPTMPPDAIALHVGDLDADGVPEVLCAGRRGPSEASPVALALARGDDLDAASVWEVPSVTAHTSLVGFASLAFGHLVLVDLDASGVLGLVVAVPTEQELRVYPRLAETRGAEVVRIPLAGAPLGLFRDETAGGLLLARQDGDGVALERYRVAP